MLKKTAVAIAVMFLSCIAWTQGPPPNACHGVNPEMCTYYTVNTTDTFTDQSTTNCKKGVNNCFTKITNSGIATPLIVRSSKSDNTTYFVDTSGNVYLYKFALPPTYTLQSQFGQVRDISTQYAGGTIVSLGWTHPPCSSTNGGFGYQPQVWNGSGWNPLNYPGTTTCSDQIQINPVDGTIDMLEHDASGGGHTTLARWLPDRTVWADENIYQWETSIVVDFDWDTTQTSTIYATVADGSVWVSQNNFDLWTKVTGLPSVIVKQFKVDGYGGQWIVDNAGYVWKNNSGTWTKLEHPSTLGSITQFVPSSLFALHTGTSPYIMQYNLNEWKRNLYFSGDTTCTLPFGCGSAMHGGTITQEFGFGDITGLQSQTAPSTPAANGITPVQVTNRSYDILSCLFQTDENNCFQGGSGGDVACNIVGTIFFVPPGGGGSPAPCNPPLPSCCFINPSLHSHPHGAQIPVYFSNRVYNNYTFNTTLAGYFFTGTSSWTILTAQYNTYVNMGIWTGAVDHYYSGSAAHGNYKVQDVPHGVNPPFIFVEVESPTSYPQCTGTCEMNSSFDAEPSPTGGRQTISINSTSNGPFGDPTNQIRWEHDAAHEEGHSQRLGDCGAINGDCNITDPSQTVMWHISQSGVATFPQVCDVLMANLYNGVGPALALYQGGGEMQSERTSLSANEMNHLNRIFGYNPFFHILKPVPTFHTRYYRRIKRVSELN